MVMTYSSKFFPSTAIIKRPKQKRGERRGLGALGATVELENIPGLPPSLRPGQSFKTLS